MRRIVNFRSVGFKIVDLYFPSSVQIQKVHSNPICNQEAQKYQSTEPKKISRSEQRILQNKNYKIQRQLQQKKIQQQQQQQTSQIQGKNQSQGITKDTDQEDSKQLVSLIDFLVDGDIKQHASNAPNASNANQSEVLNIVGEKRLQKVKDAVLDARNKPSKYIEKKNLTETRIWLREKLKLSAEDVERVCKISNIATQTVQQLEPKIEVMVKHLNLPPWRLGQLVINQPKIFTVQKPDRMERRIQFWIRELESSDMIFFQHPWILAVPISVVQRKLDLIDTLNWPKDSKKLMRACPSFVNMGLPQIEERMEELEDILDLNREKVVDVLHRYPLILNHQPAFLEEKVVSWFKRKGFDTETIGDLIRSQPRMLLGDVHLLKRNWQTLHMLGLETELVMRVFKYCGSVFRTSLEQDYQLCKLRYVLMHLGRPPTQVLYQFPRLFQCNLWRRIAPRIYILKSRKLNVHNLMKFMPPGNAKFAVLKARSSPDLYEEWLLGEWKNEIWPEEKEKVEMLDIPLFKTNY